MERTPAASAMDWSIHLEKSLRSKYPNVKRMEAVKEIGARLEWWSKEPELSMAEFDMFGLVPGEDKLFANAILLRLAETFMSGDKHTKLSVVKMFLSELKNRKIGNFNRKNKGILSKYKVENHLELLRRIKLCFNSGDEDVRALSLVLFGCWSDFAKDNAEIRYLILSSLVSCHVLEVKASLFAAGCFCEFSDDFARVLLEMLLNMISSSDMPIDGRLAGVRAFSKIGRSSALSCRAYEEGRKLILGSLEDEIVTTMLISLSIIASRSALLISRQVDLILPFLSQDKSLSQQAPSLRCLRIVLSKSRFRFSPPTELIIAMFNILNVELSPVMQHDAVHILYEVGIILESANTLLEILMSKLLSFNCSEINECFTKILEVAQILMRSPSISNRLFAMRFLADISVKFTRRIGMPYDGDDNSLASQAILFIMNRITLLTNSVLNLNQPNIELEQEIWSLFKSTSLLLNQCPNLGEFSLNKLYLYIKCLPNKVNKTIVSKLMVCVAKMAALCLKSMVKGGTLSGQIQNVTRLLIKDVCECSYFDYYVHIIYYLLLHPLPSCHYTLQETEEWNSDNAYLINNEILALEKAKKLMEAKDYWSAYKAGKYAVFQGAWFVAAFIFGELITMVQSDSLHQWLTSLTLFAYSEMQIVYCCLPKQRSILLSRLVKNRSALQIIGVLGDIGKTTNYEFEKLDGVCKVLRVSKEMLFANSATPFAQHYFQIQFLSLRANVIEVVVHVFKLLGTITFSNRENMHLHHGAALVKPLTQLSSRLMKLAREYDLVATSCIGMDPTSTMTMSTHALNCSVLAFITGFSLFFANRDFENLGSQKVQSNFHAMLIHDLVARLWLTDEEISKELVLLQKTCFGQNRSCFGQHGKTQRLENTYEVRSIIKICRLAVKGVVDLQNAAKGMLENDGEIRLQIIKGGIGLQLDVLRNWLNIFFRTPTYFFGVRPSVSCQLFAMNRDSGNGKRITVLPGYHLHLDLCLQLNNISPESRARLTKLYCILQCKMSHQPSGQSRDGKSQTQTAFHDWIDDNVLELNDKLVKHVNNYDQADTFDGQVAETIVCFTPNVKGQGFSTCMLNVSMFPLGSYEIKWRAGCLDIDGCYWSLNSLNCSPVFTIQI